MALLWTASLRADQWMPPKVETYVSTDGRARLTVTPRRISDSLEYFEDKVAGREPAGRPAGNNQTSASGQLEVLGDGQWRTVWNGPLLNDVAPAEVLVANGGQRVVTFDNWHSVGHGENVIVIYNGTGRPIRSLRLTDVLPDYYLDALPHTASSLLWGGEHRIDEANGRLILSIAVPTRDRPRANPTYLDLPVSLATGEPEAATGPDWEAARAAACRNLVEMRQYRLQRQAYLRAPLVGPEGSVEPDWHEYLREAVARIETPPARAESETDELFADLLSDIVSTSTTVLRDPAEADYAQSVPWVLEALTEEPWGEGDIRSIASPAQANLVEVLASAAGRIRRGSLQGVRVYVAVADEHWPLVVQALAVSGADLRQLDPADPIPQRPDRLAAEEAVPDLSPPCAAT
ncbi:MAG: hypothetical protein ACT4N8_04175 [Sphingosinicella sp.]|uniref:hypothetical protein n=1 Tax=Sphingosinicella sp. TaxID=1917971 RepID=UPI0040377F2E